MKKIMRIGTMETSGGRRFSLYIKAEIKDGRLSISGTEGPLSNGGCLGSCGQIDMGFAHRNPQDNDKRYGNPIKPDEIMFTSDWTAEMWLDLLDIWKKWHLNDMRSECEHQRVLGWTYKEHHNKKTFEGEACPTCGYKIGSSWFIEPLPQSVIDFLESLPDTDREPAWV